MSKIAELWAQEVKAGRKIIEDAPARLREEIKALLDKNEEQS